MDVEALENIAMMKLQEVAVDVMEVMVELDIDKVEEVADLVGMAELVVIILVVEVEDTFLMEEMEIVLEAVVDEAIMEMVEMNVAVEEDMGMEEIIAIVLE